MIDYVGARWLKCDFHLHTPASKCFKDKTVTAEMWVQRCLDLQLDCVAVTDHNTNEWIDQIKTTAAGTSLTVFPGVELTCDTSKVHLLVLFDPSKTGQDVYDFLMACQMDRKDFASSEALCSLSCIEVVEMARAKGALVIPAHIDEFNGLGILAKKTIKDLFEREDIFAAQYVFQKFNDSNLRVDEALGKEYNARYKRPEGTIGLQEIKDYFSCVQQAKSCHVSLVTFSDNPDADEPSKHGLSGIGNEYTWIKMDKHPSLESLRQALLIPDRVCNCFNSKFNPYKEPTLWIKSIEVKETYLTKDPFKVEFNPQLNTIIGGRGSGKSSVFRFLRGAFKKISDIKTLPEIKEEQDAFYRKPYENKGVLKDNTEVIVEFVRDGILYKIDFQQGKDNHIYRSEMGQWVEVTDKNFIEFFDFEQYTQKQIFAIARNPNALRELIDAGTEEIARLKDEKENLIKNYISAYAKLKDVKSYKSRLDTLATEIKDLKLKIDNLKSSHITEIAQKRMQFSRLHQSIETYFTTIQTQIQELKDASAKSVFPEFSVTEFEDLYKPKITSLLSGLRIESETIANQVGTQVAQLLTKVQTAYEEIQNTQFEKDRLAHNETYEAKKKELEEKGVDDISNYQSYTDKLRIKEDEYKKLSDTTSKIPQLQQDLSLLRKSIYDRQEEITQRRQAVVDKLSTARVKINVKNKSDRLKFEHQFREIIQKWNSYEMGMSIIMSQCFPQKPVDFIKAYQPILDDFHLMRSGGTSKLGFDGRFQRMICDLDDEQMSRLETLIPDDQIDVLYKPNGQSNFKSIVSASAGQKTTAVLTYILSQGIIPLLLDQPEDDLDNRLVCDLVVEKIKEIKENRQVIVITHNANIPVIGDAEYIVSMDSNTRYLKVHTEGMLEKSEVKKEICEIMEGGEDAFKLRASRYKSIFK